MIVIATHNGKEVLPNILNSIEKYGNNNHRVLVVDTGATTDLESLQLLENLSTKSTYTFPLEITKTPYIGYETGAWIYAYKNYMESNYLFLHDSLEIKSYKWLNAFESRLSYCSIVPWLTFYPYLNSCLFPVRNIIVNTYGTTSLPEFGFFGSIFMADRAALDKIDNAGYMNFIPSNKLESEACERFWSMYCYRLGIPVNPIMPNSYGLILNGSNDALLYMKKIHKKRQ